MSKTKTKPDTQAKPAPPSAPKGFLSIVLHAHLPFVRHPEEDYFLEENWLFEAITETYIPLIRVFDQLIKDGIHFRVTMSFSPTLVNMLNDDFLRERYLRHLDKLIELAGKEVERTKYIPPYLEVAKMYHDLFIDTRRIFVNTYNKNLISAFKKFQQKGVLEVITCCGTHGFLPILNVNESSVKAQVRAGVENHIKNFGEPPKGIWLPECGYYPGVDQILKENGIQYFFTDTHGLMHADPAPKFGVHAPVYCPSGVAAFARDMESSKQVWSSNEGYPGDVDYREYYRDIGYELDYNYVKPYIQPDGTRINTGIKYWRITGHSEFKEVYRPSWARDKAASHAGNFMFNREKQVEYLFEQMGRQPVVVAPYDAELFGHWWYEGPIWLDFLARKIHHEQNTIKMITPSEYLTKYPKNQMAYPSASSWGYKGYSEFWLEEANDWIYKHIHVAGRRMAELARKYENEIRNTRSNTLLHRALNQAARELLLAEASDWPFIMKTGTMVDYAQKRVKQHINRFTKLYEDIKKGCIDEAFIADLEFHDNIFSGMECAKWYLDKYRIDVPIRKKPVPKLRSKSAKLAIQPLYALPKRRGLRSRRKRLRL